MVPFRNIDCTLPHGARDGRGRETQPSHGRDPMTTWQEVEKHWKEFRQEVRTQWPKLTDTELNTIAGKRDKLVKTLETDYKVTHAEAEKQVESFLKTHSPIKPK
jgi:uncharacterized protein YjbJ (UPF0337 family)